MKSLRVLLPLVLLATALSGGSPATAANKPQSPTDEVLIVSVNLREAYPDGNDLRDGSETKTFVNRVLSEMKYRPDVVLLQEVIFKSANLVAKHLSTATGDTYAVVVKPPKVVYKILSQRRHLHRDTAIVINTDTMSVVRRGGFIKTSYTWTDRAPGTPRVVVKGHAHGLVKDDVSGVQFPVASVHYIAGRSVKSSRHAHYWPKWSDQVARAMKRNYPNPNNAWTLAGDLNKQRCKYAVVWGCSPNATFYNTFTKSYDYVDTYRNTFASGNGGFGVDYIFSQGVRHLGAGGDPRRSTYSDHKFRWALIGV